MFWCTAARLSELELEQRTNVKFVLKLGKSEKEIREMLVQVYGDKLPFIFSVQEDKGYIERKTF